MSRRILLLTFYYPPDLCAGSFRAGALARALREHHAGEVQVDVVTTMPNRYQSYQRSAESHEISDGIVIERIPVSSHKSGFIDQSVSFITFARGALARVSDRRYDLIFATSSRLMTAALGAVISKQKKAPLYLDIRDMFADTMSDVLSGVARWLFVPLFRVVEGLTFRSAAAINVVSPGFNTYFEEKGYGYLLRGFTNGIDDEFLQHDFSERRSRGSRPVILYAGNIGAGQGLQKLIPAAAAMLADSHVFQIVGDGGVREELAERCAGLENVMIEKPVDREELLELYAQADILLIHLNDLPAFKTVLPSKLFEYAATGKPILAGVAGFAARFTREKVENAVVFAPCDAQGLTEALTRLKLSPSNRKEFNATYARSAIMRDFAGDIVSIARHTPRGLGGGRE